MSRYLRYAPLEVREQRLVTRAALERAAGWVRMQQRRADGHDGEAPWWRGWALHAAFVAGVLCHMDQRGEE